MSINDHLVKGYTINEKRLAQKEQEIKMPQRGKILKEKTKTLNFSSRGAA